MSELFGTREGNYDRIHADDDSDRDCTEEHCCTITDTRKSCADGRIDYYNGIATTERVCGPRKMYARARV